MTEPNDSPLCRDCVFWEADTPQSYRGSCHRRAPNPLAGLIRESHWFQIPVEERGEADYTGWPHTYEDDWCGEGRLKR